MTAAWEELRELGCSTATMPSGPARPSVSPPGSQPELSGCVVFAEAVLLRRAEHMVNILTMCSMSDLTTRARIRDAAVARFGADGVNRVTVRAIASDAGVSPALVLHHFGSKDGLRRECDAHVTAVIRDSSDRGASLSDVHALAGQLKAAEPLRRYLARTLIDGSAAAATLFDTIVKATGEALSGGVEVGWAHAATDDRARAVVYVSWLLAPLVLGDHVSRALGETDVHDWDAMLRYSHAMVEMLTNGVFADQDALQAWEGLAARREPSPQSRTDGGSS